MEERFSRNIPAISENQQHILGKKHVLIVGCGGLGGHLVQSLVRVGVGEITAVDGDAFEESNLNRQVLSSVPVLGRDKAQTAREAALSINPRVRFHAVSGFLDLHCGDALVQGKDVVLDALDSVPSRLLLEELCAVYGVPLVHGAVHGWTAQVCVVPPGSGLLKRLYAAGVKSGSKTVLPMTPAFCASVQAAEAVKLLCGLPSGLEGKLLLADLLHMDFEILSL